MLDRAGNPYRMLVVQGQPICVVSPARQARKALKLSGRQYVRFRKAQRAGVRVPQESAAVSRSLAPVS